MKIENNVTKFVDSNNTFTGHKKIILTEQADINRAINEGTLTIEGVTLELSDEARTAIEKANKERLKRQADINEYNNALHNMEAAKQQEDAVEEAFDNQVKAMEIARRISKGGIVPYQDEKLLLEYSPEMYQMAKQASLLAKEREEYDTLLSEEKATKKATEEATEDRTIKEKQEVRVDVTVGEATTVEASVVSIPV